MGKAFPLRYVVKSAAGWRYRRVVPEALRDRLGRREWVVSFAPGTGVAKIEARAARLAAAHDALIERTKAGETLDVPTIATIEAEARAWISGDKVALHELIAYLAEQLKGAPNVQTATLLSALEHGGKYQPGTLTIATARANRGGTRSEKPIDAALASFAEYGANRDVREISRTDVSAWIKGELARGLKPRTVKRRLSALHAIVGRAYLDLEVAKPNPFSGHGDMLRGAGPTADDRLPFNKAMIEAIDRYVAESKRMKPETRNILRLLRNGGGLGPGEAGGLVLGDVSLDGEIPFVHVRPNQARGVKGNTRTRRVPLVGVALDAARDACKRATARSRGKRRDDVPLFPGFGASGRGADAISQKLNKAIRAAGVPQSRRLVAYSYRHCWKEALRCAGITEHVQRRIMGHGGAGVADRYGSPSLRLAEARDALLAALPYLGDVDESIYLDDEKMQKESKPDC